VVGRQHLTEVRRRQPVGPGDGRRPRRRPREPGTGRSLRKARGGDLRTVGRLAGAGRAPRSRRSTTLASGLAREPARDPASAPARFAQAEARDSRSGSTAGPSGDSPRQAGGRGRTEMRLEQPAGAGSRSRSPTGVPGAAGGPKPTRHATAHPADHRAEASPGGLARAAPKRGRAGPLDLRPVHDLSTGGCSGRWEPKLPVAGAVSGVSPPGPRCTGSVGPASRDPPARALRTVRRCSRRWGGQPPHPSRALGGPPAEAGVTLSDHVQLAPCSSGPKPVTSGHEPCVTSGEQLVFKALLPSRVRCCQSAV
jgi:hypothetical protein